MAAPETAKNAAATSSFIPLLEDSRRRSLLIFDGDATGFFTRPNSGTLLVAFVVVAVLPLVRRAWRRKEEKVPSA